MLWMWPCSDWFYIILLKMISVTACLPAGWPIEHGTVLENTWPRGRRSTVAFNWNNVLWRHFIFGPAKLNVTLTVVESCLLSGWSFISSLIHRPDHVSPLKESQGIDLYTCWLLLTCHSRGVAWHSLAHCCDMCSHTLRTAHLVVSNHCSFRLCIIEMDTAL